MPTRSLPRQRCRCQGTRPGTCFFKPAHLRPGLADVQLTLPARLSFAQRIASLQEGFRLLAGLAPLLVGLFLMSLAAAFHLGRMRVGIESYLLAGCSMALFFPLLVFLSGIVNLVPAAIIALLLVSGLLLAFLGQQVRWRVGLLLIIFLGFFSLGILTPWQGLMLTSGGLLLVGISMLLYARRPPGPAPEPAPRPPLHHEDDAVSEVDPSLPLDEPIRDPESAALALETVAESGPSLPAGEAAPGRADFYCPSCARALADDYRFCPGCGYDTNQFRRCNACGVRQFVPEDHESVHCLHCGHSFS